MYDYGTFKKELRVITEDSPPTSFFIDDSKEREISYSMLCAPRWFEVLNLLNNMGTPDKILDVGTSPFTFILRNHFKEVCCIDYTDSFQSRCNSSGIRLYVGGDSWDTIDQIPDDYFDCITFLEVLEHLHINPEEVLQFFKRKLKNGGLLVLTTPNMMCLRNRVQMLLNRRLTQFTYPPFKFNEHSAQGYLHDRIYMPAEMKEYFTHTGWKHFSIGYHCVKAVDDDKTASRARRLIRFPAKVCKHMIPSLRGLMLITATK